MGYSNITAVRDSCQKGVPSLLVFTPLSRFQCPNLIAQYNEKNKPLYNQETSRNGPQVDSFGSDPKANHIRETINLDDVGDNLNYGIHWLSPAMMIGTYLFGVCLAVALHCYYSLLSGEIVGNIQHQQNALRFAYPLGISDMIQSSSNTN